MKILYIHGFGSKFDPTHEKIQMLETLGTVVGVDVDYCKGYDHVSSTIYDAVMQHGVDLIVGTSMGGYMSAQMGNHCGVPFVALNPAVTPSESLQKWVGNFTDHVGRDHSLSESTVSSYPDITTEGCGLVIVETADEVIPAYHTQELLQEHFQVEVFKGGEHRFAHMEAALPLIKAHVKNAGAVYDT